MTPNQSLEVVTRLLEAIDEKDKVAYRELFQADRPAEDWKQIAGMAIRELYGSHWLTEDSIKEAIDCLGGLSRRESVELLDYRVECYEEEDQQMPTLGWEFDEEPVCAVCGGGGAIPCDLSRIESDWTPTVARPEFCAGCLKKIEAGQWKCLVVNSTQEEAAECGA